MTHRSRTDDTLSVQALGVHVQVRLDGGDEALVAMVRAILPPGHSSAPVNEAAPVFGLAARGERYEVTLDGLPLAPAGTRDQAIGVLDAQIRLCLAVQARAHVVVHAGAVAWRGQGIVLPGRSFAGKSTLVAALLRAGATYYSDEFAVLGPDGRLHPYARPISLRNADGAGSRELAAGELGARAGEEPVPVGLIALTRYEADATWLPRECTSGEGLIGLMVNTPATRERADAVMPVLRAAVADARVLEGPRGDATVAAPAFLRAVEQ